MRKLQWNPNQLTKPLKPLLVLIAALALPLSVSAQSGESGRRLFEIPEGSLGDALFAITTTFDANIIADEALVRGLTAPKVSDRMTSQEALRRVLANSGLLARTTQNGAIVIEPDPEQEMNGQQASGDGNGAVVLDEIVVRGELLERTLQDTQSSVHVFQGIELDRHPDRDLFDLLNRTAGVAPTANGRGLSIRGINSSAGPAAAINVSVDGAVIPASRALTTGPLSTWDLQQVEILRGPQSTQSGINSLAGAVNIRSSDPTFEQELKARVDVGEQNELRLAVAANVPLSDQFAFRLSAEDFRNDGNISNRTTGEDIGITELQTLRAKLRYRPSERLDAVLTYSNVDNRFARDAVIREFFPDRRVADEFIAENGENDTVSFQLRYDLDESWSFVLDSSYIDVDHTVDVQLDPSDPIQVQGMVHQLSDSIDFEANAIYESNRLRGVFGFYGIELNSDEDNQIQGSATAFGLPPGVLFRRANLSESQTRNYAVFGELEYYASDLWTLVAGIRYDLEQQDDLLSSSTRLDPPVFEFPAIPLDDRDTDYDALLPKIGAVYQWSEDVSTGLTIQRSYRAGGSELTAGAVNEFDPEFTTNYEFSFRSAWLDGRLTSNANVFFTDWTDQQIFVLGPSGTFLDGRTENAGESELYGFEFENTYRANDSSQVYFNLGYSKTEYKELIVPAGEGTVDLAGNEFPDAPRWTAVIGGSWRVGGGWSIDIDGNYTDEIFSNQENLPDSVSDSYFLVNARVGYEANRWSAHLYGRNLLDRDYLAKIFTPVAAGAGDSRVVGLTLSFRL